MQKDERILQIKQNLSWLPQPNESRTVLSSQLPLVRTLRELYMVALQAAMNSQELS